MDSLFAAVGLLIEKISDGDWSENVIWNSASFTIGTPQEFEWTFEESDSLLVESFLCSLEETMLWYYAPALFILLHQAYSFPRGKSTEKPEVPEMVNPQQRRPAHISEFTDPDTGRNPFLDLEEGRASMGRNVMEDERRDDEPYFDIDLVEGDVPDHKRIMEDPVEHLDRTPTRWLGFDNKEDNDFRVLTTTAPPIAANPPTTVEAVTAKDVKEVKSNVIEEVQQKNMKGEKESFVVSPSTVIYATATLAVMTVIILLVGACWWRKKLKTSRSTTTVESGEAKS